jgi:SAM-dependent methyltransferase
MARNSAVNAAVQEQFGAAAPAYATSAVHATGPDLPALVAAAALTGRERVLDLGTGAGHTAMALAPHAASVAAVDLTPAMLSVAAGLAAGRGLTNVTFREADASALPFPEASFDVVACRYAAHHFAEPALALREAARVLVPGGRFVMVDCVAPEDPALDTFLQVFEFLRDASHVRDCRASEWLRLFAGAGFDAEVLDRSVISLDGAEWVKRMNTPPEKVAMIRRLFAEATPAQRAAFELRAEPWGFSQASALLRALRR